MSQPNSVNLVPAQPVQKQQLNVYTMMLIISFVAIVTACLLLYLELRKWGAYPWWNTSAARTSATRWEPADGPRLAWKAGSPDTGSRWG